MWQCRSAFFVYAPQGASFLSPHILVVTCHPRISIFFTQDSLVSLGASTTCQVIMKRSINSGCCTCAFVCGVPLKVSFQRSSVMKRVLKKVFEMGPTEEIVLWAHKFFSDFWEAAFQPLQGFHWQILEARCSYIEVIALISQRMPLTLWNGSWFFFSKCITKLRLQPCRWFLGDAWIWDVN